MKKIEIIGMIIVLIGIVFIIMGIVEGSKHIEEQETDCYDNEGSKINGLTCTGAVISPEYENRILFKLFGGLFVSGAGIFILKYDLC